MNFILKCAEFVTKRKSINKETNETLLRHLYSSLRNAKYAEGMHGQCKNKTKNSSVSFLCSNRT